MPCLKKLTAIIGLSISISAHSQQPALSNIDSIAGKMIKTIRNKQNDQTFITTDKSIYTIGESIWFRVFLLHTPSQKLNLSAQTVIADIVNEKNMLVTQLLLHNDQQQSQGKFTISDSLPTGYYWLRAYTQNMLLQTVVNFTEQPVYIYNPNKKSVDRNRESFTASTDDNPQINFFPEGGSIMTGVSTTVAITASDKNGNPLPVDGYVKDNRDSTIAHFTTSKNGLGKFDFEPYRFRKYTAVVTWKGKNVPYNLPAFNPFAAQVSIISQTDGGLKVRVLLEDSIYSKDFKTNLVAIARDSLCFASIGNANYELIIPAGKFPPGIASFFLFDANGKLLSERNLFIKSGAKIQADLNKTAYEKRAKATMNISVTDAAGSPELSSMSVAVAESHFIKPIENEKQYLNDWQFVEDEHLADEDLDIRMMVGKNHYPDFLTNETAKISKTIGDSLLYIRGVVKDNNNVPVQGKILTLFTKTGNSFFDTDTTDATGKFCFRLTDYPDSTLFSIQSSTSKSRSGNWNAEVLPTVFPKFSNHYNHVSRFQMHLPDVSKYLTSSYFETGKEVLLPVTVSTTKTKELDYDKSKRASSFSRIITGKQIELAGGESVSNAVLSLPGLQLLNGYLVFSGPTKMASPDASSEPLVVVDGIVAGLSGDNLSNVSPVMNYLNGLNSRNIDFIEVFTGPEAAIYGVRGGNGVIIVNTNSHDNGKDGKDNALKTFYAKGYSYPQPFVVPSYEGKKQTVPENTDLRSTVYWNPSILTDKNGKATFSFYTNDVPGNYVVTLRGVTSHGDVVYKTLTYTLK